MGTFHPFQNAYRADPYPYLDRLRESEPCHYSPELQGFVLTRYEECAAVLRDESHFLSDPGVATNGMGDSVRRARECAALGSTPILANSDGTTHSRLRATLVQAFNPRAIEAQAKSIQEAIDLLLDRLHPNEPVEVMSALAEPLPVEVLLRFIGIAGECREPFRAGVIAMMRGRMDADRSQSAVQESFAALRMLGHVFDRSLDDPGETLLRRLDAAVGDGAISAEEMVMLVTHVATAGNAATAFGIGNMLLTLSQRPGDWDRLRANPQLVPAAVEECLRFECPTHITTRFAGEGAQIREKHIAAGRAVHLVIAAANRDPAVFPHPAVFDQDRKGERQLAFGLGGHFCLGAPLARLEMQAVLSAMLRRFSSLQQVPGCAALGGTLLLRGPQRLTLLPRT